jgi:hypothetical protein
MGKSFSQKMMDILQPGFVAAAIKVHLLTSQGPRFYPLDAGIRLLGQTVMYSWITF